MPIYWAILTYILLKPGSEISHDWFLFPGIDKVVHLGIFAVLAFSIIAAFPKMRLIVLLQILLSYAFLTEILQGEMNLGRSLDILDVIADMAGSLLGIAFYQGVIAFLKNK